MTAQQRTPILFFLLWIISLHFLAPPSEAQGMLQCPRPKSLDRPQPTTLHELYSPDDLTDRMRVTSEEATDAAREDRKPNPTWAFKGALLPGWASRMFRPLSFSFSGIDQLDRAFDGTVDPDTGVPNSTENPDPFLKKVDVTIKPGQIFRTTSELQEAYSLALDDSAKGLVDALSDPLIATADGWKLRELAWNDGKGKMKRLLRSIDFTFGYSERSLLASKVDVPTFKEDDAEFVYSFSMDLDSLVVFPGEVLEAYSALESHTKLSAANESGLPPSTPADCNGRDRLNPVRCLRKISDVGVRGRWLAGLLPKLTIKTVDQFDFILAAGQPFPLNEKSLETVMLTWDLGSALDSAKHRRAAIKALSVHERLVKRDQRRDHELVLAPDSAHIRVFEGFPLPVQLQAIYRTAKKAKPKGVQWTVHQATHNDHPVKPKDLDLEVNSEGTVNAMKAKPGTYKVWLCLQDDVNNYTLYPQELKVQVN